MSDDQARRAISDQLDAMDDRRMRVFLGWLATYRPEVLEEPLADFLAGGARISTEKPPAATEQNEPSAAAEALAEGEIGQ